MRPLRSSMRVNLDNGWCPLESFTFTEPKSCGKSFGATPGKATGSSTSLFAILFRTICILIRTFLLRYEKTCPVIYKVCFDDGRVRVKTKDGVTPEHDHVAKDFVRTDYRGANGKQYFGVKSFLLFRTILVSNRVFFFALFWCQIVSSFSHHF